MALYWVCVEWNQRKGADDHARPLPRPALGRGLDGSASCLRRLCARLVRRSSPTLSRPGAVGPVLGRLPRRPDREDVALGIVAFEQRHHMRFDNVIELESVDCHRHGGRLPISEPLPLPSLHKRGNAAGRCSPYVLLVVIPRISVRRTKPQIAERPPLPPSPALAPVSAGSSRHG